ncbi:MAG: metal-transporting ATPase [Gammaproteobacteria bacterium RIFCSPHIGHO2_02_FULL_42_13]|nr:MAG: metal-transporting ATPase [Gammaproteobacteria bacterium RIFCSPHIGHO2_02_FULL_42_13]OGT69518.1 MAG: metal-transporting ATPase [Gammaproteobacteria bacterium RIFCSPLOWO2_02_FULL_42_9]
MDCAEEVKLLKRALAKYISNENQLNFNLIDEKLTVDVDEVTEAELMTVIAKTGMKAVPWTTHVLKADKADAFWAHHGRVWMAILSAVSLLMGYVVHGLDHGFVYALMGPETTALALPLNAMVFYVVAILAGGWFIFPKAWYSLRHLRPDMNLLMTIAVIGAVLIGKWFEAGAVAFLFSVAVLLESWSVGRARQAIRALLVLAPSTARIIKGNDFEDVPIENVEVGAIALVRPGEKIPLDGKILKGSTHINQAPITGESMPVSKKENDEVYASTINGEGAIEMRITKLSQDTTLARIIKQVENAQENRAASEQWVEVFARYYTPIMMLLAIAIVVIPPLVFGASWSRWFYEGLVILVIACPCALVISTPVSIVAGLSTAARFGVLIKGGAYLELPSKLRAIAFDKTGTLTKGKPDVQQVIPLNDHSEQDLLQVAAALEMNSEHPIARAICARAKIFPPLASEKFQSLKGKGAEGYVNGKLYWIGSHRLLHEKLNEEEANAACDEAASLEAAGQTVVIMGRDDHACGLVGIADTVREQSKAAMQMLKQAGVEKLLMLTGDNEGTAKVIAAQVGVDEFKSELLPEDKIAQIKFMLEQYKMVAMVGDGVNDAPAMALSSLGIAMGAIGSDAAIETADIALMTDDLTKIPWLIHLSKRTLRIIKENIVFAVGLKAVFLVLAIMGIATLWMAIAADMGASLLVIFNGLRLLRVRV